ncbi:MAG: hypothetical protein IPK13_11030 [Deltaproteobacteria bacterium]|nr:hypothetical protein [Deltaproteobacteria bacterium]
MLCASLHPTRREMPCAKKMARMGALMSGLGLLLFGALSEATAAEVLEPEPIDEESYTESFVAFMDAPDGTYFKVQLGISNVGPGDRKGACRVLLAKEGTAAWSKEAVVDADWDYARGVLRIGKCRASIVGDAKDANHANHANHGKTKGEGEGGLRVEGEIVGRAFILNLREKPRRERVMRVVAGTRFYESDVMIPWASADLVMTRTSDNQVLVKTQGTGYADHSRSTTYPADTAQRWIRFRALNEPPDGRQLVLVREPKTGGVEGWVWADAGRKPVTRMRVAVRGAKHAPQVRALIDGEGGPWRVTSKTLLFRHAPLENRGVLGSLVGVAVGNPVTYTYRAVLETKRGKPVTGLLEMAISDE